jgi:hypothetical protein
MFCGNASVQKGAGAQHAVVLGKRAGNVGERIWRIGDNEKDGVRRGAHNFRNDVTIELGVCV